jgi:hypothetical protein
MLDAGDFVGRWRLDRAIMDRNLGQTGAFRGTADLRALTEDVLHYAEAGQVQLGDGPIMTATRDYEWRFVDGHVDVTFSDGAAFHRFVPSGAAAGTDHPCGSDFYQVAYDFIKWPDWTATWTVSGPRKDYTSVSRYTRLA